MNGVINNAARYMRLGFYQDVEHDKKSRKRKTQ
jgi:hypothetical protein